MQESTQSFYTNSFRKKLFTTINSLENEVFRRSSLGVSRENSSQLKLNRALKAFIAQGIIIKLGHNLYAKASKLYLGNSKTIVALNFSFEHIAIEVLNTLGVKWTYGKAIEEYNQGKTTQIPIKFSVRLFTRFRGTIAAEGRTVHFEDGINAR